MGFRRAIGLYEVAERSEVGIRIAEAIHAFMVLFVPDLVG